jgi:uncharacterized LabA/DUF88 family protein
MSDRTCAYIDGESHYIRSEKAWKCIHGEDKTLAQLRYPDDANNNLILLIPEAKVFWTRRFNPGVTLAVYFTAASGDKTAIHNIKVTLREVFDLEPHVEQEPGNLASQRANMLNSQGMIEKAKQVDIVLATRMLSDAFKDNYDEFHLYTSDVDFLPVIEKAQVDYGKRVFVYGYRNGLARESPLLYVPSRFIDLEETLRKDCVLMQAEPAPEVG